MRERGKGSGRVAREDGQGKGFVVVSRSRFVAASQGALDAAARLCSSQSPTPSPRMLGKRKKKKEVLRASRIRQCQFAPALDQLKLCRERFVAGRS